MTAAQELVTVGLVSPNAVGTSGPITFARELGWLKEEGIEVRFIEFNGSATMLPQLAGKRITLGWPNPDPLISSHDTGKDPLPIRMFYNVFRNSVWEFAVLENSPIRQLTDLKGKKVGVLGMTSGNIPITKAQFRELGMQVGRDVDLVPVGAGAPVSVALTSGRIDAVNHYSAQLILMEQQGLKLRRLHQLPRYADLFSNGFAAHNDTIASRGELLGKFGRVYAKGEIACYANLPDCIRSFWRAYPEKKPNNDLGEEKNLANAISAMEDSRDMIMSFAPGEPHQLGWYNRQIWTNFIQILHEGGQISTTAIDPDKLYTNSLVESMNKFSVADVEKMAKMLNSSRR
jgi:NitT/TauT family transport system substrate-binding protein